MPKAVPSMYHCAESPAILADVWLECTEWRRNPSLFGWENNRPDMFRRNARNQFEKSRKIAMDFSFAVPSISTLIGYCDTTFGT
jgi:hypothetical protein